MAKKAPDPVDRHVGGRVRMQRMLLGLSQEKLSEAIGVTFQQVQKYEKGTNRISASRLQQIANVLKVPVAFFFEGAEQAILTAPGGPPDPMQEFATTTGGIELARAYVAITDKHSRQALVAQAAAAAALCADAKSEPKAA